MRSNAYWETRARQRMARYHRAASSTIDTVTRAYDKAVRDLTAEIEAIFETFGNNGQLGPTMAKQVLNEAISRGEWDALKASLSEIKDDDMRRQVLTKLNAPAYRARITRLQALKAQAYVQSKVIADAEFRLSSAGYVDTIQEAYYRTMFDLHKGLGFGFDFAAVPNRVVQTILKRPWSGQHFSSRIWSNTDILADQLTEVITAGFMSGAGLPAMRRQLQDLTGAAKFTAARLIRTETTYMANAAEIESYVEAGVEQYRFVATLDNRTSPICQDFDGQLFDVKDAVPGKNLPPMHPNCRSTTRAFLAPEALEKAERRARNPKTGETYQVPANMSYKEWRQQYAAHAAKAVPPKAAGPARPVGKLDRIQTQLPADYMPTVQAVLDKAPDEALAVWNKFESHINIADYRASGGAYYPHQNHIKYNLERDKKNPLGEHSTLFHEIGHLFDANAGAAVKGNPGYTWYKFSSLYKGGEFDRILLEEASEHVDRALRELKKIDRTARKGQAYAAVVRELRSLPVSARGDISDIFEGATKGKIQSGIGHGASYWKSHNVSSEAFAEMYSAIVVNPESLKLIKQYFPRSYDFFLEMLREMVKI